ncbi:hypothetical protein HOF92_01750 [bacterium]|jgi:hypothetical protein|nr:hypothetical protein [bacterium]
MSPDLEKSLRKPPSQLILGILSVFLFLSPSVAENPDTDGIEIIQSPQVAEDQRSKPATDSGLSSSADFRRFPVEDPESEEELRNLKNSFAAFMNDPGNAGFSNAFLGKFPQESSLDLQTKILKNEGLLKTISTLSINSDALAGFDSDLKRQGKALTLQTLLEKFPRAFSNENKESKLKLFQFTWESLEQFSLSQKDSQKKSFQDEHGKEEQRTLPEEIMDRLNYLLRLGSSPSLELADEGQLTSLYIVSWYVSQKSLKEDLAADKDLKQIIKFDVPGGEIKGDLDTLATRMQPFYYQEVLPVSEMVTNDFQPLFENKIKPALASELSQDEDLALAARSFERQAYALKGWEKSRGLWLKELNRVLTGAGLQPLADQPQSVQLLQSKFRRIAATLDAPSKVRALKALKELTRANLVLARLSAQASESFKSLYSRYKERISEHKNRVEEIVRWIQEFNQSSQKSYSTIIKNFSDKLFQRSQASRMDIAFQAVTSRCLLLFPSENFESMAIRSESDRGGFTQNFSLPVDSISDKRLICLADYELKLRGAYPASANAPFLGDGIRDLNLTLDDFSRTSDGAKLETEPKSPTFSLYALSMGFLRESQEWIPENYAEIMKNESKALQWAIQGKLEVIRLPESESRDEVLSFGQGVVHNLSARNYFDPSEIIWRTPDQAELFRGAWLAVTIGDSWLMERGQEQKGDGLGFLLKVLEPYLGAKGVRAYLVQMSLRNQYFTQETDSSDHPDSSHSRMGETPAIFPTSMALSAASLKGRVGIGLGLKSEPGQTRPIVAQVGVQSLMHWEGVGQFSLQPRHDFRHLGKHGPIYQIYLPLYFLQGKSATSDSLNVSKTMPGVSDWKRLFSEKINSTKKVFGYENGHVSRLQFGDVLFLDGMAVLDGSGAPRGSKTPGIHVIASGS